MQQGVIPAAGSASVEYLKKNILNSTRSVRTEPSEHVDNSLLHTTPGKYGRMIYMGKKIELEVRLDEAQVARTEEILMILGLSLPEAVSMFLAQVLLRGGLPFNVALPEADDQELMDGVCGNLCNSFGRVNTDETQLSLDDDPDLPWDEDVAEETDCGAV